MEIMAGEEKICKYLDIPVQHFDDRVLRAMNRRGTSEDIRKTIEQLRKRVSGIALRTSLIVGFPGETGAAFKRLLAFVNEAEFEHLGVFTFSPEEGTVAYDLDARSHVPEDVAAERVDRIMKAQAKISMKKSRALIGSHQRVLIDGMEDMTLVGRISTQAPEIDGVIYLSETAAEPGKFVEVTVTDAREYDLTGKAIKPEHE
jgi:ribosomal protein S12 methylthiotransferase